MTSTTTTISMTALQEVRRQACALNNMAVSMLRLGEFEYAIEALDSALSIMYCQNQGVIDVGNCHGRSPGGCTEKLCLYHYGLDRVKAVQTRLTKLTHPRSVVAYLRVYAVETNEILSLLKACQTKEASAFFAIQIRDPTQTGRLDFDRESGIILYNFGLACFLSKALSFAPSPVATCRRQDVERSLEFARSTFANILSEYQEPTDNLESVFCAMLILSTTSKIFRARQQEATAQEAEYAVQSLYNAVGAVVDLKELLLADATLAAAA